ncbi:MAG: hypothetical protein NT120_04825 [Candidatus Aenigmarchaeota archaeon]|nr:hypothetical protein [Candidatus Aenigmarchaeota archaeon]
MPENPEKEIHDKDIRKDTPITVKKSTLKIAAAMIVVLVVGIVIGSYVISPSTGMLTAKAADKNTVGKDILDIINKDIERNGGSPNSASLIDVSDESGLYKVVLSVDGSNQSFYATKDGKFFLQNYGEISAIKQQLAASTANQPTSIPKTDKPSVELFVMAFCPFGVQAEQIMKPVVDLLGSKADINVRFIVNIAGNTADSVNSLHGATEAMEDLRQVCINKYYPAKYWSYVENIDANCYSVSRDSTALDACWKAAATNLSMDVTKIDTCSKGTEGIALLKVDETISNNYVVSSSPTLIINGVKYNGARTSEAFKTTICNAFNTPPAECGTAVNSTVSASASSAGCGA